MRKPSRPIRRVRRARKGAAAALALAAVAICGAALAAPAPLQELVPEGPIAFVGLRDAPAFFEKVRSHPRYQLFCEPELKEFVDGFAEGMREPREELARALGMDPKELEKMLGGQLCVAVLPRGDRDAHFLLLADVSGEPELARSALDNLLEHERTEGQYLVKEESFRGYQIHVVEPIEEAEPPAPPGAGAGGGPPPDGLAEEGFEEREHHPLQEAERIENPGFLNLSEGILAVASSPDRELIEKYLVLREGGDLPSLSRTESFRRLGPYLGEEPDLVAFFDVGSGLRGGMEGVAQFGLEKAGGLAMGLTIGGKGIATQGLLLAPAPRQGVLRAFPAEGPSVLPPPYVAERVGAYGAVRFHMGTFWQEIMASMQRENPQVHAMIRQQIMTMPVDVENDVIGALGSRWFLYVPPPQEARQVDNVVSVELERPEAFAAAWQQIVATLPPQAQMRTLEFMGFTVYQSGPEGPQGEPGEGGPASCLAILGDKVVHATDLDLLKTIIKDDQREVSPLRAEAEFRRLMDNVMEQPDAMLMIDARMLMRWARSAMEAQRRMVTMQMGPEAAAELPEPPPWAVLEKYQTRAVIAARWNEDGLRIRAYLPDPPREP